MACVTDPPNSIDFTAVLTKFGTLPVITDAKSLYDSARSMSTGIKLNERRTAIEMAILKGKKEGNLRRMEMGK